MTYIGITWFILAEFNFYWQNITSTGRISLPLAEHDLIWLIVTLAGRIWLILAEYDFHWQNMIYTGLLSLLLAEYAANQKCSAVLLCSADSIYPNWAAIRNTAGAPGGGPRPTQTWVGRGWSHLLLTYDWCCPLNVLHAGRGGAICGRFLVVKLDNAENSAYMQGCPIFPLHVSSCSTGIGRRAISLVDIYLFIYLLKIAHEVHDRRTQH